MLWFSHVLVAHQRIFLVLVDSLNEDWAVGRDAAKIEAQFLNTALMIRVE